MQKTTTHTSTQKKGTHITNISINKNKEDYFDACFDQLSNILDSDINLRNIVKKITQCMKIVESFKKLSGVEKKDLVIDVMQKLIRESNNDENIENMLIETLEHVGHPMIDTIIAATKGKVFKSFSAKMIKCFGF